MNIEEFISGVETHEKLNPKIWQDNDQIRPEVRASLLKIAREFYKFLDVQVNIIDVIVTGSQANYLYTHLSDLDLHVIVPYDRVECPDPVRELFDTKRKLWKEHHDIKIHGIPVEAYAEDSQQPVKGSSYSLIQDRWIRKPEPLMGDLPGGVERSTRAWTIVIAQALRSRDISLLHKAKHLLSTYRKAGLARDGETSLANITFKTLRNNGVISMLMQGINRLEDRRLSIQD